MKRVLIVDDAATARHYHRAIVEAVGCVVEEAANGVEALEKALTGGFDLLLIDINMPKMDGNRLLHAVRRAPELHALPAIVVSTEVKPRGRTLAMESGANLYLVKPVSPESLGLYVQLILGLGGVGGTPA